MDAEESKSNFAKSTVARIQSRTFFRCAVFFAILLGSFLFFHTSTAWGATWYVSNNGNDAYDGVHDAYVMGSHTLENDGNITNNYGGATKDYICWDKITTTNGGVLRWYKGYFAAGSNQLIKLALYTDNNNSPGDLIANTVSDEITSVIAGWNTFPVIGGTTISAGTTYWIAHFYGTALSGPRNTSLTGGQRYRKSLIYGELPSSADAPLTDLAGAAGGLYLVAGDIGQGPWLTISMVRGTIFSPGDNVYFNRGDSWSEELHTLASGTSDHPITYGAYGSGNKPFIRNIIVRYNYSPVPYGSGEWLVFQDMEVSYPGANSAINYAGFGNTIFQRIDAHDSKFGFSLTPDNGVSPHDVIIRDSNIYNNSDRGIWASNLGANILIQNNKIYDNVSNGISAYPTDSGSSIIFEYNECYGNAYGFAASSQAADTTTIVRYNNLHDNIGGAIQHSVVSALFNFYGNIVHDNSNIGLQLGNVESVYNANVYNNTIANNIGGGLYILTTGNVLFKNNILHLNGTGDISYYQMYVLPEGAGILDSDHNIITDKTTKAIFIRATGASKTLAEWKMYSGGIYDQSSFSSDPLFVSTTDYHIQSTSPVIDSGTDVSLTTDYEGNPIYGLPDIGGYEYQPIHDMAVATPDQPQIGEAIRVYGNGKFRNTVDDSEDNDTDTAKLSIVPQGSITTEWLDLSISAWNTSGDYHKQWTENSDTLGSDNTLHTIGDLVSGQAYSVKIDNVLATANITGADCSSGVCTADENGEIIFTYTGGYSEHTFDIEDETAPVIAITSPETGDTVSSDDTITFTDTEETDLECSIDNANWINCQSTVTSFNDLTGWDDIEENDTLTLYLRDTDGAGNIGTTSVANLTKADTQAPIRSNGSPEGELSSSTTQISISLTTSESAVCKYSVAEGTAYSSMTDAFANVDGTAHSATVSGLSSAALYNYYVRCQDESENANDTDYLISFSIAAQSNDENTDENNNNERDLNVHSVKAESTENSITLTWRTDHNTKSSIRYGTDKNLKEKKKDSKKEKKHKLTLSNLLSDTTYYFRIKSTDGDDNEDKSKIHSIRTKSLTSNRSNANSANLTEKPAIASYSGNATPNACSYTIQAGDTLWKIAQTVYGDGSAYPKIIEKNKDKYPAIASYISVGQELVFDCQNSGDVQGQSDVKNNTNDNNKTETSTTNENQEQEPNAKWWNPFSWF